MHKQTKDMYKIHWSAPVENHHPFWRTHIIELEYDSNEMCKLEEMIHSFWKV